MDKLVRVIVAHRLRAGAALLLLFLAGLAATPFLVQHVAEEYEYPGLPAWEANQRISAEFGTGGYERPFVPVITLPGGQTATDPGTASVLADAFDTLGEQPGMRVAHYGNTEDPGFLSPDRTSAYGLVYRAPVEQGGMPGDALGETPDVGPEIAELLRPELPASAELHVTGLDTLATSGDAGGLDVPVKLAVAVLAAAAVLYWLFRSALALVPLLIAAVAVPISMLVLLAVSTVAEIPHAALMALPLIGLGIAIDYALLLVTRWREERSRGASAEEATRLAMTRAGNSVVFSGVAVAIGLAALTALPIPFLRGLGLGGMAIALSSVLVTLVLFPMLLVNGRRWLVGNDRAVRRDKAASATWTAIGRWVVRHRRLAAGGVTALLGTLAVVAFAVNPSLPNSDQLAEHGPGHAGLTTLRDAGIPSGVLGSFDVYLPDAALAPEVTARLGELPGVRAVAAPEDAQWRSGEAAVLSVVPVDEGGSVAGQQLVSEVRAAVPDGVLVGGNTAQQLDYVDVVYTALPVMIAVLGLVTFVLLARAFRSLLLPVKAILVNLLSLGAVLGILVLIWQFGWGTEQLFGIPANGTIGTFVPVTVFAFLYGLSMDYEVFVLARIREEYDRTSSTQAAVVHGLGRTGRLVSCAALILCLSFGAVASGGELDVAMFASGIAVGIILDATLVRGVLVPATVAMFGRWNWWLPAWAARLLRVPASPVRERAAEGVQLARQA
ncbi:MMPL family transporter [Tamaricihabitans halophyticus]|nr:MMPL family transporter [Tamaricihabitans halophyticus]